MSIKLIASVLLPLVAGFAAEIDVRWTEAVASGDAAAVRTLVQQRADVNALLADGSTALHWAVRADDLETTALLLGAGANVKAANRYGVTPLYLACVNGNAAMIRKLLDAGADANSANARGETVLMIAARTGTPDALQVLLDRGAAVNAKDGVSEETALMWAVRENHADAVRLLLTRGAEVNARTTVIKDPPKTTGNLQGIGRAQNGPAPVPMGGVTPLLYAARDGRLDLARMLIAAGADINAVEANGTSPLVVAIINGHIDVAQFLLEHGANPNAADGFGRAALWSAVDLRNLDLDNKTGENPTDRALVLGLIQALLERGASPNAALAAEPPSRRWMLPFGASTWVNLAGQTPLLRAALSGDVAVMRLLLAKGADPNLPTREGTTPLMAAAGVGWVLTQTYVESKQASLEAVKLCVEKGADVNAVNSAGITALHGAALRGSDDIIEFLAKNGARLDVKDKQGRTPSTFAEGIYMAGKPPERRPATIALLQTLASR
jgi:ankyrin repeat protein